MSAPVDLDRPIPFALATPPATRTPACRRPLEFVARALERIADELHGDDALRDPRRAILAAASDLVDHQLAGEAEARRGADALGERCAHCARDRGDHLVAPPHLCEDVPKCPGYLAPGQYASIRDTERPPPPAVDGTA